MSRRNQSRRRRSYGRRQHEVRERRFTPESVDGLNEPGPRDEWLDTDNAQEPRGFGPSIGGYLR